MIKKLKIINTDWLVTGGIGDVIALDALWTPQEKAAVETIHWGTRCGRLMMPIFARLKEYTSLKSQIDHWDYEQNEVAAYVHADHAKQHGVQLPPHTIDRSIWFEFHRHKLYDVPYQGSSFLSNKLADLSQLGLPERYAVIVPCTPANLDPAHRQLRDYRPQDWANTLQRLRKIGIKGVVVNSPNDMPVPDHPSIIDLTGRTTLAEGIEVVKGCEHYVGIDSWASIVAALVHEDPDRLRVLSRNIHLYSFLRSYYPRHTDWSFASGEIKP